MARYIPFSVSVTKLFSKHNNFKFKGFIILFSFFVTVAEGAEGPSSGFEVIGRKLAELDEGRSQEAMDNFFTILIHHKQNYFVQHTMSDSFTLKTDAAPQTLVKIVSN